MFQKRTTLLLLLLTSLPLLGTEAEGICQLEETKNIEGISSKNERTFLASLFNSTLSGATIGILIGYLNKITYNAAQKNNYRELGWLMCWYFNPILRSALMNAVHQEAKQYKVPYNNTLADGLARILDWFVYFDAFQFLKK
jgi:hypothetical protein